MTPSQFSNAIAQVESGNVSNPPLGDGGRAIGRYQMHPDWVMEWAVKLKIFPMLGELWDSFFGRLIQGYFTYHIAQALTAVQIAVSYHLGHICRENDPDWDLDYASRFVEAARGVGGLGGRS